MARNRSIVHGLLLVACFVALARPDRLWSSVQPRLDPDRSAALLEPLALPSGPGIHDRFAADLERRILELQGFRRVPGAVAAGQSLDQILRAAGVAAGESLAFARSLKPVLDPRKMRPGDSYELLLDASGQLFRFDYRRSALERYRAQAADGGWTVEKVDVPVERREAELAGRVAGSLYESFLDAGGDADLIMAFADLFSWDVDFGRETREGDEFRMIYEKLYAEGEPVGNGRILAARYSGTEVGEHTAIHYRSAAVEGYFDPKGHSVQKAFLRSPLRFNRISSRFSRSRRHPVLNVVRPHSGVDYAAPAGTPVWSVAEGTVTYAGWKGQAGKTVSVRHARGYETFYNHLSRFGAGVRKGARVAQGQVIGYVGQTGLATGPHLDFRVRKEGRWVNPLRERYVDGKPVPAEETDAYLAWAQIWLERLAAPPAPVDVALEAGK